MGNHNTVTFQDALETIESLPEQQQEDLITIIKKRIFERRRETLAENIREARDEYARGEVKEGDVADIMNEISEWGNLFGVKPLPGH